MRNRINHCYTNDDQDLLLWHCDDEKRHGREEPTFSWLETDIWLILPVLYADVKD